MPVADLPLAEASRLLHSRKLSPVELVSACLERIARLEPVHQAFVHVRAAGALADARAAERELAAGRSRGLLHGIPLGIKDIVDTAGIPTTCSSRVRAGHVPTSDATVVARLAAAGAITIGKTNTHEFAAGNYSPPTRNAWDATRTPGGSSGGSGAAVALGMCTAALGTDTGGSIRVPASFNGIVGLKPTYGRVPKNGITMLSWSLDHCGPMTRTVEDAALLLGILAGRDRADPTSAREPVPDYTAALGLGVEGLRLGLPPAFFREQIQPAVLAAIDAAAAHLAAQGAILVETGAIDGLDSAIAAALGISLAEAAAYHAADLRAAGDLYQSDTRAWFELGSLGLGTHYVNAQRARAVLKEGMRRAFEAERLDALLVPTVPLTALPHAARTVDYPGAAGSDGTASMIRCCGPFNLTGQPFLSVPCGFDGDRLPIGLGIAGRPFQEDLVLRVGHAYEQTAGWCGQRPPATATTAA